MTIFVLKNFMKSSKKEFNILVAAALMYGVAAVFFNTSPILVGVMVESFDFDNAQVGQLIGAFLFATAAIKFTQIFWLRRVENCRSALLFFLILSGVAFFLSVFFASFFAIMICFILAGLGVGAVYGIALTLISDSNHPDRGFGGAQLAQMLIAAPLPIAIPFFIYPTWGYPGVMTSIAAFPFMCLLLLKQIPANALRTYDPEVPREAVTRGETEFLRSAGRLDLAPIFALLTVATLMQGVSGFWVFVERIGVVNGIDGAYIGSTLVFASIFAGVVALIPIVFGSRFGRVRPVAVGILFFIAGLILINRPGEGSFFMALLAFAIAYPIFAPYVFAQVSASDSCSKYTVALPAVIGISYSVGPVMTGSLFTESYIPVLVYCAGSMAFGLVFMILSEKFNRKDGRTTSSVGTSEEPGNP